MQPSLKVSCLSKNAWEGGGGGEERMEGEWRRRKEIELN